MMLPAESDIEIGVHPTFSIGPLVFNIDTVVSTAVAAVVVILLGLLLVRQVSNEVPGKVQIAWETLMAWVNDQVESNLGKLHPFVVPLAAALFVFILVANWFEIIPTQENLTSPTADTNLAYALALLVIVGVHVYGVREHGVRGYGRHFMEPLPALLPLNIMEEIIKPVSLSLRLFGNIFAGGIMISLIGLLPGYALWLPNAIWKLFDMAIGGLQAFIFALLTILYFGIAGQGHGDPEPSHAPAKTEPQSESARHEADAADEAGELQPA